MTLKVKDLHKDHALVRAAHKMVSEHEMNDTMVPALEAVHAEFPEVEPEYLIALWVGINAKNLEGRNES